MTLMSQTSHTSKRAKARCVLGPPQPTDLRAIRSVCRPHSMELTGQHILGQLHYCSSGQHGMCCAASCLLNPQHGVAT